MRRVGLCGLLAAFIIASAALAASGATWHIYANGSGDAPTIKAAVGLAAAGDSIVVFAGTYNEHDIYVTKQLFIVSVAGETSTIIDAQSLGRCFLFSTFTPAIKIKGFTLRHGTGQFDPVYTGFGGAVICRSRSNVEFTDCSFRNNSSNTGGAAVVRDTCVVTFKRCSFFNNSAYTDNYPGAGGALYLTCNTAIDSCLFVNNTAQADGGAISASFCQPTISHSTFHQNQSGSGQAAITLATNAGLTMSYTIVTSSSGYGIAAWSGFVGASFYECDVYGNAGGNYGGLITDPTGLNYNISLDPMYCDPPGDLSIATTSPCGPDYFFHWERIIGRYGPFCGPNLTATEITFNSTAQPAGTNIEGWYTIRNTGAWGTGSNFWLDFYFDRPDPTQPEEDGDFFGLHHPLAAGDSSGVWVMSHITCDTSCVEWQSRFWIDKGNNVPETDETDNMKGPYTIAWQPAIQSGWPVSTGAGFHSSPVIAAIDDDPSTLEIAIGCDNGKLYAWKANGTALPGFPVTLPDSILSSPAVGDVTGDYRSEIVVGCKDGGIYVYDCHGTLLWNYATGHPVKTTPSLADLNADGKLEIICASWTKIHVLTGGGELYKGWPYEEDVTFAGTAVGDVDGDGVIEIAAAARSGTSVSKVYLFEANGKPAAGAWPVQLDGVISAGPALGDIIGSHSNLEIVVGDNAGQVHVITEAGVLWGTVPQVTGSISSSPIIEDIDADGHLEIVVASKLLTYIGFPPIARYIGYVTAIDHTGAIASGWPNDTGSWASDVGPVPSPVGLGTHADIMNGSQYDRLYSWYGSAVRTPSFPVNFGADVITSAAAGQIDVDNWVELVVATSAGTVYCRELRSASYPKTTLWWPMYGHDRARTHCYGFTVPLADANNPPAVPTVTALGSIYPNPFNPTTRITFDLSAKGHAELTIYDVSGRKLAVLVDRELEAGRHEVLWNGKTAGGKVAASGVYFCTLRAAGVSETKKLVLLR